MIRRLTTEKVANLAVAAVLALVPFHAFLTIFGAKLAGHYTLLRLWDDVLLLLVFGIAVYWLARDKALRGWFFGSLLVRLIAIYCFLTLLLGVIALLRGEVVWKALSYGVLVNLRFLVWFLAVLLTAGRSNWLRTHWQKLVMIPAALVVVFATLQYTVLPHNFLSHFGYNADTNVAPIETINHNSRYIRVQSFLRGANPLGAYLVVILSVLTVFFVRGKRRILVAVFGLAALFALFATGSRSAWIGTAISLAIVLWFSLKTQRSKIVAAGSVLALLLVAAGLLFVFRNNTAVQNSLLHTQNGSKIVSSNDAHADATESGVKDVLKQPLGDGPGTAGPASVYNSGHNGRIAEDYYVQIAQEVGWLGLVLFVSIVVLVAMELLGAAGGSRLGLALLASLIGVSFVNVLSHAWTDDTLAYLWWGLAGIALGGTPSQRTNNRGVKTP